MTPAPNRLRTATGVKQAGHREESLMEAVQGDFEALALNGYEARVLLALLRLGSGSAVDVSRAAEIHRASVYPVLKELESKGLAFPLPGRAAVWSSPGADEVLGCLQAIQEQRLRDAEARMAETRRRLTELIPEDAEATRPPVQLLRTKAETNRTYARLLAGARSELLMFTRPPFVAPGKPNPAVLDARSRGVSMRVLYRGLDVAAPGAEAELWRKEIETYHAAGVEGRIVPELPIKLSIFDREAVLASMSAAVGEPSSDRYPSLLLVQHSGFAQVQVDAFEAAWSTAVPYEGRVQ